MHGAARTVSADLQARRNVLDPDRLRQIEALWQPAQWPTGADAYAKAAYRRRFGSYVARVARLGLSGGVLLDAGCGGGAWSFAWATRFDRVIGFDIAAVRIAAANFQKARLNFPGVDFLTAAVRKVPAESLSADVVYCRDVLSHLPRIDPVLQEFYRVLKPGGVCHLGLAGMGSAYERAKDHDPRRADLARKRIYTTVCRRSLMSLVDAIGPGRPASAEAALGLQRGMSAMDLLVGLGGRADQIEDAERISRDLGADFNRLLLDDFAAMNAGQTPSFADPAAARVWSPDEVIAAGQGAGFGRAEWAPDGWLSLRPDGEIDKAPRDGATPEDHEFEGGLRAFEILLWKPDQKTWPAHKDAFIPSHAPRLNARIGGAPTAGWKLTSGNTTYWNAGSRELLAPIIESRPPAVAEFDGAIITSRHLQPADGIRFSTGAVYDRHHRLLAPFFEREAYETAEQKLIRIRNSPYISEESISDAEVLNGTYIYLGIFMRHFGHFFLESLSHIWYLLQSDPGTKVIFHQYEDPLYISSAANYLFNLIGLTRDRIKVVSRTSVVEHLIFPESEFEIRWKANHSFSDTFSEMQQRSARRHPCPPAPRKVYFTRRHLSVKREENIQRIVANEADVETLFAERGFTIVAPEQLPLNEQIAIAAGADQIAGLKGSALHLSLFNQRPTARLIQIGREQSMNHTLIDGLKNMESHQIFCKHTLADIGRVVDLEPVRAALREI
jgi:capsular polysaccharide biosynthesis protein